MGEDLFMEFLYGYFFNYLSILHQTHPNPVEANGIPLLSSGFHVRITLIQNHKLLRAYKVNLIYFLA